LDDLQAVIAAIQEKQASEKKMRNLTRLKKFLEAMDEYGKVIEIFLNNSQFIAFVWVSLGPTVRLHGPEFFSIALTSTKSSGPYEVSPTGKAN
jgi:hypothetical protein